MSESVQFGASTSASTSEIENGLLVLSCEASRVIDVIGIVDFVSTTISSLFFFNYSIFQLPYLVHH